MEKRTQDYTKEILEVIRSNISPAVLSKRLQDFHENDIADVLPELSSAERNKLYRIFDLDRFQIQKVFDDLYRTHF